MNPVLAVAVALVSGYALGSVSFAVWVGRMRGIDIYKEGSGNPGMSNVARTMGKGAAAMVLIGDTMKGVIASAIGLLLLPTPAGFTSGMGLAALAGLAAVVGHCYPVLHGFKGGKGMATSFGVLLFISPAATAALALLWFLLVKTTGKASLGSLAVVVAAIPVVALIDLPDVPSQALWWLGAMLLLVVYRHKENIARLRSGGERTIEAS
jgi:glycerol-3-phosphate acyltransferase PlsY